MIIHDLNAAIFARKTVTTPHGGEWIGSDIRPLQRSSDLTEKRTKRTFLGNISKHYKRIALITPMLLASGCGATDNDKFTLKTAMPANF
ncbi:hypothetical protein, partial [Pseudomonas sp.]|uniref:hypothetical protein n=1 Tax=Pseudomonas sp. TaxID=306 RepID=UPI00262C16CF